MAARAGNRRGVEAGQRERGRIVIEYRTGPGRCGMAYLARLREPDRCVRWACRGIVFRQMARDACCHRN